jgi:hypothetical protein
MPKALFRLLHAAGDARVAGEAEFNHGNIGCSAFALSRTLDQKLWKGWSLRTLTLTSDPILPQE